MMSEKRNVPKLRFHGFNLPWIHKTLSELLEFKNGLNAAKEDYGSGYKFINVLDIIQNEFITHDKIIGSVNVSEREFEKYSVEFGDILFQRSSETRADVGQASVYLDTDQPATFGGFVIRGKKIGEYDPAFLNYLLKTPATRNDITSKSGGSTRYNVGQETLSQVSITTTSLPEQQKIASFLTAVDRRIELLQQKKEKLERYKKGVLQQLFTRKIRFKADDGSEFPDWEEKKLGDVAKIYQPKTISQSDLTETGFDVFGANGIIGKYHSFNHEQSQVAITCRGNTCGTVNWTNPRSWITGNAMVVNVDDSSELYKRFLYYALRFSDLNYLITGSGQPQITGIIKFHKIHIPKFDEQLKICQFLDSVDQFSKKVAAQIQQSQTWKKGLLQQMFV